MTKSSSRRNGLPARSATSRENSGFSVTVYSRLGREWIGGPEPRHTHHARLAVGECAGGVSARPGSGNGRAVVEVADQLADEHTGGGDPVDVLAEPYGDRARHGERAERHAGQGGMWSAAVTATRLVHPSSASRVAV